MSTDIFANPETREGAIFLLGIAGLGLLEPRLPWVILFFLALMLAVST